MVLIRCLEGSANKSHFLTVHNEPVNPAMSKVFDFPILETHGSLLRPAKVDAALKMPDSTVRI